MQNVVLTVHLILALLLTGVVLLQRSEGGGLGMGGGGGAGGGVMTGRQAANALTKLTWGFGIALFCTSVALTILAARDANTSSVMDQLGASAPAQPDTTLPALPSYTPPPGAGQPVTPPTADAPATAPAAATVPATPAPVAPATAPVTPPASN